MPSLEELVTSNATKDDIKDVPPIPVGTYLAMIVGPHQMTKSSRKQTTGMEFDMRFLSAQPDVDQFALQDYLEKSGRNLNDVTMKHTFWDSPIAAQQVRDFVYDHLGIDKDLPMKQALADVPGKNLYVTITHRPIMSNDGTARLAAQVNSTARAD